MKQVHLNGESLDIEQVIAVAVNGASVTIDTSKLAASRNYIVKKVAEEKIIYGVTTGFGSNTDKSIAAEDTEQLQINLLRSHACGVGKNFSREVTRAAMVIRLNTLLKGYSGVQESTVAQLQFFLNNYIHPAVPEQGSVGASGDLCPLAHMALPLMGEGEIEYQGQLFNTEEFLQTEQARAIGFKTVRLSYKEGLALTNGTTFICAAGAIALWKAQRLLDTAIRCAALIFEAIGARTSAYAYDKIHLARRHRGQIKVAQQLTKLLEDSTYVGVAQRDLIQALLEKKRELLDRCGITGVLQQLVVEKDEQRQLQLPETVIFKAAAAEEHALAQLLRFARKKWKPQDAYSIRCVPQVLGASEAAIQHVEDILNNELNAAGDNPLIFPEDDAVVSGGNFHGQPVALIMDYLKLAVAEIGNLTERQINKLVDGSTNDALPSFLIEGSGLNNGLMISQYAAAAIVSENKVLVHPASADSIPTCENTEDHVSMGTIAARQAIEVADNVERVLAIALMTSYYAFALRRKQLLVFGITRQQSMAGEALCRQIAAANPALIKEDFFATDRFLSREIKAIAEAFFP
ncbi:MAG: aromatic amino acid ammonia-lyase [Chitinophagales bacterium]